MASNCYAASNQIDIYPISKVRTGITRRSGRLLYEANVAAAMRHLFDVDGFIYDDSSLTSSNDAFEATLSGTTLTIKNLAFMLYGYDIYVSQLTLQNILPAENTIYASLKLDDNQEVDGQDNANGSAYTGVIFTRKKPGGNYKSLAVLTKTASGEWVRPDSSRIKFTSNTSLIIDDNTKNSIAARITSIDGKYNG